MRTGRVKVWREDRCFGFISPDDGGPDLFVHLSNVTDSVEPLPVGARVKFNTRAGRRSGRQETYDVVIQGGVNFRACNICKKRDSLSSALRRKLFLSAFA
jgi:CspA family cold shock protein